MITQQVQIKINLPLALKEYVESKASKFDMPIAGYIKHLILSDVEDLDYPVFKISEASEKRAVQALKDRRKAIKVTDVHAYFNNL